MSEGVVGDGVAYFEQVVAGGLEGVMAKRLSSPYRPGARTDDWVKIKQRQEVVCVVIGYEPSDDYGLRSLIVATEVDGELRCVGKVGSGIPPAMLGRLLERLGKLSRAAPAIACSIKGRWVEPELLCRVSYAEVLETGNLRAPVFEGLIDRK